MVSYATLHDDSWIDLHVPVIRPLIVALRSTCWILDLCGTQTVLIYRRVAVRGGAVPGTGSIIFVATYRENSRKMLRSLKAEEAKRRSSSHEPHDVHRAAAKSPNHKIALP